MAAEAHEGNQKRGVVASEKTAKTPRVFAKQVQMRTLFH
jgi:hypothetical protein